MLNGVAETTVPVTALKGFDDSTASTAAFFIMLIMSDKNIPP